MGCLYYSEKVHLLMWCFYVNTYRVKKQINLQERENINQIFILRWDNRYVYDGNVQNSTHIQYQNYREK